MTPSKSFRAAALLTSMLCMFAGACDYSALNPWDQRGRGIVVSLPAHEGETKVTGEWEWRSYRESRHYSGRPVYILFESYDQTQRYSSGGTFSDLQWNSAAQAEKDGAPVRFALVRPAGRWNFQGTVRSWGAEGNVEFQPNSSFVDEVTAVCGARPTVSQLVKLAIFNVSLDGLRSYRSAVQSLDVEGWLKLLNYGVKPEFAESMMNALGKLTPDALIECRNYGVTPEFAAGYSRAGYPFSHKDLIQLKNYGVSVEYAGELKRGGMSLNAEQLVQLHNYGVQPSYALRIKGLGFGDRPEDIIAMRNYGVPEEYVSAAKDAGYQLSRNEIIELRNYGVPAEYLRSIKRMGYSFSIKDIIKLRNYGVSETYLAEIIRNGGKPLSADLIIDLHSHGVPAGTVRAVRTQ